MGLFGKRAAAGTSRPALSRTGYGPAPAGWPQGYEAQVRAGYLANPVAQRSVRLIAEAIARAPIQASEPALAALLTPPLRDAVASQLLLHGNAFVQPLADEAGRLDRLYPLRPERISVEPDAAGWPAAWRYAVGTRVARLPVETVIHLKTYHPLDDHLGLGCLGAAAGAIAAHNAASRWNASLLENAARPSGALVYDSPDGASLSREQFDRLREELEAGFAGGGQAGRPMLLEGGLKWQALSLSPTDMDYAGLKATAAREIALAFGVPPMLLGLPGDATYANYKEANRALWRLSVLPMAGLVLDGLAAGLARWFPGGAASVDLDSVPALADDRATLWASVTAADFLTRDEKRAMVDIDPPAGEAAA